MMPKAGTKEDRDEDKRYIKVKVFMAWNFILITDAVHLYIVFFSPDRIHSIKLILHIWLYWRQKTEYTEIV